MKDVSWRIKFDKREDGVVISTVKPPGLAWYGEYETAIAIDGGNCWRVYEGYQTKEDAIRGHDKYKQMTKEHILDLESIG